tara:strand:- start:369 stop:779 length:411 start_codon:yes stop_codon:yes gene_type:complete
MRSLRSSLEKIEQVRSKVKVLLEVADIVIEGLEKEDWDKVISELKKRNQMFNQLHKLEGSLASLEESSHGTLDGALPLLIAEMGELAGKEKVLQTKLRSAIKCIRVELGDVRSAIRLDHAYNSFKLWSSRYIDKRK